MKYKLKDIEFDNFKFDKVNLNDNKIININYNENSLEFQTPKIIIENLIKENDHEYISCRIIGNKASETFCSKMLLMESFFNEKLNKYNCLDIKSIFNEDCFIVKIPFKYSRPQINVYKDNKLFNYYHLTKGMTIICLVNISKIWINYKNESNYNINVKEIMVI